MDGKGHLTVGVAIGVGISLWVGDSVSENVAILTTCAISSLAADLDMENSHLAKNISLSHKLAHYILFVVGIVLIAYSWLVYIDQERITGMVIGASLIILPRKLITKKTMILLTGSALIALGINITQTWLISLGLFVAIAPYLSHRGLTHSIFGLGIWAYIMYAMQMSLEFKGLAIAGILGYLSHLIADMKIIPKNKRGVKWFQPFNQKEF